MVIPKKSDLLMKNYNPVIMDGIIHWPHHQKLVMWGIGLICFIALTVHNLHTTDDFWLATIMAVPVSVLAATVAGLFLMYPYIVLLYILAFIAELLTALYQGIIQRRYPT